jgi:hypothetical protein
LALLSATFAVALLGAPIAQAASDALFVFTPKSPGGSLPPPLGFLEGSCGMGVDPLGHFYVSDYYHDAVDVYDTATPQAGPVEVIDGTETPNGKFVSLRDASVAVDRVTGEIYVIDNLQPKYTERPQAIAYVFAPNGTYEGHLKFLVTWGMPVGLTVDNSETATQGRVYVTSGNSAFGAIYAYGPGSATTAAIDLPNAAAPPGAEPGSLQGQAAVSGCAACEKEAAAAFFAPDPQASPAPAPSAKAKRHRHHRKAHRHNPHRVKAPR